MSASLSFAAYQARRYFSSLDGIRALAILAVVWHHTTQPVAWLPGTSRGFLGVDIFFVLSGYLIVMKLLRERDRSGDISLRNFYMRRTLRIFPIYYTLLFVLAILFFIVARNNSMAADFRARFPYYITYTSNLIHDTSILAITWSLAAEEQFYIVWPPIEKFLRRFTLPVIAVLIFINQLVNYRVILAQYHGSLEILQSTFTPILFGVALAHILHSEAGYNKMARVLGDKWAAPLLAVGLIVICNIPRLGTDISGTTRLVMQLAMVLLLAACVIREDHWLEPLFRNKVLVRLSAISYGMYLYHMLVRHVAGAVLSRLGLQVPFDLFVITLIGTIIVAELSFRYYEKPFMRLKERWATVPTASNSQKAAS